MGATPEGRETMTSLADVLAAHQPQLEWYGQHDGWRECTCMKPDGPAVPWSVEHQVEAVAAAGLAVIQLPEPLRRSVWPVVIDGETETVALTPDDDDIHISGIAGLSLPEARYLAAALLAAAAAAEEGER